MTTLTKKVDGMMVEVMKTIGTLDKQRQNEIRQIAAELQVAEQNRKDGIGEAARMTNEANAMLAAAADVEANTEQDWQDAIAKITRALASLAPEGDA